jgi:hypothetical protein
MRLPHIKTPLPGPKAQALIDRDRLVSTPPACVTAIAGRSAAIKLLRTVEAAL